MHQIIDRVFWGVSGAQGLAARITGAEVETLPADGTASVELGGTDRDRTFTFKLPRGLPGTNAAANDEAFAAALSAADAQTHSAASTLATSVSRAEGGNLRPEWFGAAGDGQTDDTSAINSCLDAAGERGTVIFSAIYKTSNEIVVAHNGVRLLGVNGAQLLCAHTHDGVKIRGFSCTVTGLNIQGTDSAFPTVGIHFSDRTYYPATPPTQADYGRAENLRIDTVLDAIRIDYANHITIENIVLTGVKEYGVEFIGGEADPTKDEYPGEGVYGITGLDIHNVRAELDWPDDDTRQTTAGIWGSNSRDVRISDCYVANCLDVGIDFENCKDSAATNNTVEQCANGAVAVFFAATNIQFRGNTIRQKGAQPFTGHPGNALRIAEREGIRDGILFADNLIDFDAQWGIPLGFPSAQGTTTNVTIRDNIWNVTGTNRGFINITVTSHLLFLGNTIQGTAVQLRAITDSIISDNTIIQGDSTAPYRLELISGSTLGACMRVVITRNTAIRLSTNSSPAIRISNDASAPEVGKDIIVDASQNLATLFVINTSNSVRHEGNLDPNNWD